MSAWVSFPRLDFFTIFTFSSLFPQYVKEVLCFALLWQNQYLDVELRGVPGCPGLLWGAPGGPESGFRQKQQQEKQQAGEAAGCSLQLQIFNLCCLGIGIKSLL